MTGTRDTVLTAGAYVRLDGRYVFMVGFPGSARDRLGVVRLGGRREPGEDAWTCAAREVWEESTLHVTHASAPATYWIGHDQDIHQITACDWTPGGAEPAPLLVGWRLAPEGTGRLLSQTFLADAVGNPSPAAETQALLLLTPHLVRLIATRTLTLRTLRAAGGDVLQRTALPDHLPLEPRTQLLALALLLDRHPELDSA